MGKTAPPKIAVTKREPPVLVNLPKSDKARGHIVGHMREHPSAMKEINQIDIDPGVNTTSNEPVRAIIEQISKAFD